MRYRIMVREWGHDYAVEVARVDTNPENMAEAFRKKKMMQRANDGRKVTLDRYDHVFVLDTQAQPDETI